MAGTQSNRPSLIINWIARIIGLIILVLLLMILTGESVTSIREEGFNFEPEMLYIIIPTIIAIAAYVLSWWYRTAGGSILVIISIVFGVLPTLTARQHQEEWSLPQALLGWLALGFPFLVTGALFLISAYLDRKTTP